MGDILGISLIYLEHIFGIFLEYVGDNLGIFELSLGYLGYILMIS